METSRRSHSTLEESTSTKLMKPHPTCHSLTCGNIQFIFYCISSKPNSLYGIVLSKLLLCGNSVDKKKLYDEEIKSLVSDLPCDVADYTSLINFCFHPSCTAPLGSALVQSLCIHHFTPPSSIKEPTVDVDEALEQIHSAEAEDRVNGLIELSKVITKTKEIMESVGGLLADEDPLVQRHAIGVLSTLSRKSVV